MASKLKVYHVFLLMFFFSYFVCLDVKWHRFYTDTIPLLKYFPVILSIIVLFKKFNLKILKYKAIFLLLIIFIAQLFGSFYTIIFSHQPIMNSFLGRSLNMIIFFSSFCFFLFTEEIDIIRFFRKYISLSYYIVILYFLLSLSYVILGRPEFLKNGEQISRQLYHEELYFLIPSWIFFSMKNTWLAFIPISLGLLSFKFTGYGLFLLNFLEYLKRCLFSKLKNLEKVLFIIFIVYLSFPVAFFILKVYLYILGLPSIKALITEQISGNLYSLNLNAPTGNLGVRFYTYSLRISQFLHSPIWGSVFIGNPNIKLYSNLYIPSHSDLLDILSFSGILGFSIFIYVNFIAIKSIKHLTLSTNNSNYSYVSLYALLIILSFLITCSFNPIILHPSISSFYWFWMGFALANYYKVKKEINEVSPKIEATW